MVARTVAVVLVPPWLGALLTFVPGRLRHGGFGALDDLVELPAIEPHPASLRAEVDFDALPLGDRQRDLAKGAEHALSAEECREGKGCVSTLRSGWSPYLSIKKCTYILCL